MAFRLEVPPGRKSMEAVQVVPEEDGVSPASKEPEFPGPVSEMKGLELCCLCVFQIAPEGERLKQSKRVISCLYYIEVWQPCFQFELLITEGSNRTTYSRLGANLGSCLVHPLGIDVELYATEGASIECAKSLVPTWLFA